MSDKPRKGIVYNPADILIRLLGYQAISSIIAFAVYLILYELGKWWVSKTAYSFATAFPVSFAGAASLSLIFAPFTVFFSFWVGFPALVVGWLVSLWLLRSNELRAWVWVILIGSIGLIYGIIPTLGFPDLTFARMFNFGTSMCALTAGFCGYFMARHAVFLSEKPDTESYIIPAKQQQPEVPEPSVNLKKPQFLFMCLFGIFSLCLFGLSPFLIKLFLMSAKTSLFFWLSYGLALPVLIAGKYLTLRFLKQNERRVWVWIMGFTALGVLPGLFIAAVSYPRTFHPVFYTVSLQLCGIGAFLAAVSGLLMWLMMMRGLFYGKAAKLRDEIKKLEEIEMGVM
ncbi:MAG: hypothetical protein KDI65_04755 [Alphaproteobacteria bacterium]|nr:hypothetical protein [Alphaproteobacteria bacterium]